MWQVSIYPLSVGQIVPNPEPGERLRPSHGKMPLSKLAGALMPCLRGCRLGRPRPDHPGEELGSPRFGLWIVRRRLPRAALRRTLDDPGHFDQRDLSGSQGACVGGM